MLHPNDIVFARTGNSTGRNYFYDERDGAFAYAGFLIKFSIDESKVNLRYIKYYAPSKTYWDWVSSFNTGSTRGNINAKTYDSMPISLPMRHEQDSIVTLCDSISDKIRANSRLNDYLAELLLAKYDQIFGPFDANNCDGTLANIGEVVGGATPSKAKEEYYCHGGIGWITPRDLSNTTDLFIAHGADDITQAGYDSCSAKLLPKGSVLFSSRAPIGYLAVAASDVATNQGFKSVVPKPEVGTAFVYCFLYRNKQRIADMGAGTTFPEVSGKTMKNVELAIPAATDCKELSDFAAPILSMLGINERENRELAKLRDTLLPELMSGEIDVPKVGSLVE